MSSPDSVRALAHLGFTNLEAEIYAFLVGESPATGYRIAQAIGKPAANTYKAIQSLERKGAVVVEDGASRQCRAVPVEELLGRLTREFQASRDQASRALKELGQPKADERVYQIRSLEGVLQRLRQMLVEAKKVVLAVVPSIVLSQIQDEIEAAAKRGVDVLLRLETVEEIEGVETVTLVPGSDESWRELRVVVDGEQNLVAFLSLEGDLINAVWSGSVFLSVTHHKGLAAELNLQVVSLRIRDEAGQKRLLRALAQHRVVEATPGHRQLIGEQTETIAAR
jgi:sugar-specific transcriptional regulator TrmB